MGASHIDAITEIDSGLRSGSDTTLITGTSGTDQNLIEWDANGDAIDSGIAAADAMLKSGATMTGKLQFSGTTFAPIELLSLTTTERNALTPAEGDLIYNETDSQIQGYMGAAWANLGAGAGGGDPDQNLWSSIQADSGSNPVPDTTTDTLTFEGGTGIDTVGSSSLDKVTIAIDSTVLQTTTTIYDYLWVPAGAAIPRTTNGAEAGTPTELATNDIMLENLAFDTATEEAVGFWIAFPLGWDAGTIKIKPVWTAASGSGTVKWDFSARAYADSDAIDQALGSEQNSTDTLITANDAHIGPTTSVLTIAGTPADGEPIYLQVARDVATDTLGVDALLIGFHIEYARTTKTATAL